MEGDALADNSRQPLRPAVPGRNAQLHFRLAELCVLARDPNVARHRELAAAAQRKAVDRGDDRFAARLQSSQHGLTPLRARFAVERPLAREIADVGAGNERFGPRAGENRSLDLGFGRKAIDGRAQLEHHLVVESIQFVGTIDDDERDTVLYLKQQGLVGHGSKAIGSKR